VAYDEEAARQHREMLAWLEEESTQDKPPAVSWVPNPRLTYISFLETLYKRDPNPSYVWEAIKLLDPLGPEWVANYLRQSARNVVELAETPPDHRRISDSIRKALGFDKSPFRPVKAMARDRRLAHEMLYRFLRGAKEETAKDEVAKKAKVSPETVGNAWRPMKAMLGFKTRRTFLK
jgi:hypothetical protein